MREPRYDEGQWPILVITMPPQDLTDAELHGHLDRVSAFTKRGAPYVQVLDVRLVQSFSARGRRLMAERTEQDDKAYPGVLLGVGVVLSSALHRGVFKAMAWLISTPRPAQSFSEVEPALSWARHLLAASNHSAVLPVAKDISKRAGTG